MDKGLLEAFQDLTCNFPEDYVKSYNKVLNGIKALEIIKKYFKFHHIGTDTGNKTFHIIATSEKLIPAEDYYLLKEVLYEQKQ